MTEPFTIQGKWWRPGQQEAGSIFGILAFDPDSGLTLELSDVPKDVISIESSVSGHFEAHVIHGLSIDGEMVSLCDCVGFQTIRLPGISTLQVQALWLIVGIHCADLNLLDCVGVRFSFVGLEHWLDHKYFEFDRENLRIAINKIESADFLLPSIDAAISYGITPKISWNVFTRFEANSDAWIKISYNSSADFELMYRHTLWMKSLASLSFLSSLPLTKFVVFIQNEHDYSDSGLNVYFQQRRVRGLDASVLERPLVNLPYLLSQNEDLLNCWIGEFEKLSSPINFSESAASGVGDYLHTSFWMIVQAAESLHRNIYGGTVCDSTEYDRVRA